MSLLKKIGCALATSIGIGAGTLASDAEAHNPPAYPYVYAQPTAVFHQHIGPRGCVRTHVNWYYPEQTLIVPRVIVPAPVYIEPPALYFPAPFIHPHVHPRIHVHVW